jgi:HK97 family phage portal protein
VGIFDWLGPLSAGGKARGWDALPTPTERKAAPPGLIEGYNAALTVRTLVHGPGADSFLYGSTSGAAGNSAVFACLQAIATAIAEPELRVYRTDGSERIEQADTELGRLLARPNPHFSLDTLLAYLSTCLHVDGNAYWRKLRAGDPETGNVVELWPISPTRIAPRTEQGSQQFIDSYRYYYNSTQFVDLPPSAVVHFRYGLDDRDHRIGCSALKRLVREISSDDQATRYADRLLANLAINGLTLSFDKEAPPISQETADELKARITQAYGGDNAGGAAVLSPGATLTALGFSPEQMDMKTLHRVPEERISAVLGVPAIVAGLGAGLERCIISNMRIATPDRGPVEIQHLEAGDTVWAVQDGRVSAARITWAGKTGHRDVFTVKTPNRTLTATDNHPFLVRRMEKMPAPMIGARRSPEWRYWLDWVPLRDLVPGDAVVSATRLPDVGRQTLPDGMAATEPLLEWLGAFVVDGSYMGGEADIGLTMSIPANDRVGAYYRALTEGLFTEHRYRSGGERPWKRATDGRTEQIVARVSTGESYHAIGRALGMNDATVRSRYISATREPLTAVYEPVLLREVRHGFAFSSAAASRWVRSLGFRRGARLKRIPPWVFGMAEPLRLAFLRGLLDTDGSVDKRGLATFTFASEELVHDVWYLAVSCGVAVSNVRAVQMKGSGLPNAGLQESYAAWVVAITNADDVRRIGTHDPKYRAYLDASTRQTRRPVAAGHPASTSLLPEGCAFTVIQSITPAGTEDVYDLTVEDAHNFIAQGLVVHNSTYSNVREARELFTEAKLLPLWRFIAGEITQQLVPDFTSDTATVVDFDTSDVRALADDENAAATRLQTLVAAGILTVDEARAELGYEAPPPATPRALPRAASRRAVRALPVATKAIEDIPRLYEDLRESRLPTWELEVTSYLDGQARRVTSRLRAGADTASDLVTDGETVLLGDTLEPLQRSLLSAVSRIVEAELGVSFQVDDPATREYLRRCGINIAGITDTTRAAVQDALLIGQEAGEGIPELARRLRDLPAFDAARARTVSRTELGTSQNQAAIASYTASGVVVGVRVLDGDYDEGCQAMNGRTFRLGQEPAALQHPNCTRAILPITDADELTRSA